MSKRKGTRAEHRAIKLLEAAGYCCTRAGGSLGLFDVDRDWFERRARDSGEGGQRAAVEGRAGGDPGAPGAGEREAGELDIPR